MTISEPARRVVQTPVGDLWLWGDPRDPRPLALIISGAFAHREAMWRLPEALPEAAVLFGHIPGHNCPRVAEQSVDAYVDAYDDLIRQLDRPVVVCGASLGGVVAIGLRSAALRAVIALDPPMRLPAPALTARWRPDLAADPQNAGLKDFLWNVFGIGADAEAERDHFPLLDRGTAPVLVLAGSEPARPELLPSLLAAADRVRLAAHPRVTLQVAPGVGHDIGEGASRVIVEALRSRL